MRGRNPRTDIIRGRKLISSVWDRALEVQHALSERGQLRAVRFADLLIAATAERHGLGVLHYDQDYDLIAQVTDQPTDWVAPRGSLP
jgi:predicted nucleic acid-binding protein